MTAPAACVIAQQDSSSTFVSLRFHSRKEEFGPRFKKRYLNLLLVSKLRKLGSVCFTKVFTLYTV
jgi:hypothetical protein